MDTNHGHENGEPRNPSVGYDKSDLGARGIVIFFVVLAIFAIGVHLGVLAMYVGMTKVADKHDVELSPLAPATLTPRAGILTNTANVNAQRFPEPRLQNDDTGDMTKFLLKQSEALTASSRQDAQDNVHPPIDEAMKMVVSQLLARSGTSALTNYPGAGREYANQPAPSDADLQPNQSVPPAAGQPEASK